MEIACPVVLASGSPRRRELLQRLIEDFEVLVSDVDETLIEGESPKHATVRLARAKARAIQAQRPNAIVIAADTLVATKTSHAWKIFGKPADANEANEMLRALSDRAHYVTTGYCVLGPQGSMANVSQTCVRFRDLSDAEISDYVATGDSLDKAGGYAIQGRAAAFVLRVEGSITNVVGLPLVEIAATLAIYKTISPTVS